jgi:hypothetical protein
MPENHVEKEKDGREMKSENVSILAKGTVCINCT